MGGHTEVTVLAANITRLGPGAHCMREAIWGTLGPSPVQEPPVGFTGEGWGSASCALTQPGTALPPGEALNVQVPLPPALLFPEFPNAQSTPFSSSAASSARADGCSDGCPATLGVARAS